MSDVIWRVGKVANAFAIVQNALTQAKVDPSSIVLTITKPDLSTETRTFIRTAPGEYEGASQIKLTEPGFWKFVLSTTGVYEDIAVVTITVYPV